MIRKRFAFVNQQTTRENPWGISQFRYVANASTWESNPWMLCHSRIVRILENLPWIESTSDSIIEKTINMFLYTIYRSTLKTVGVIGWTVGLATLTKSHRITIDKREMKMAPQVPENLGFWLYRRKNGSPNYFPASFINCWNSTN